MELLDLQILPLARNWPQMQANGPNICRNMIWGGTEWLARVLENIPHVINGWRKITRPSDSLERKLVSVKVGWFRNHSPKHTFIICPNCNDIDLLLNKIMQWGQLCSKLSQGRAVETLMTWKGSNHEVSLEFPRWGVYNMFCHGPHGRTFMCLSEPMLID